jgi:hypothetical protein
MGKRKHAGDGSSASATGATDDYIEPDVDLQRDLEWKNFQKVMKDLHAKSEDDAGLIWESPSLIDLQRVIFNQCYDPNIRKRIKAFAATHSKESQSTNFVVPQSTDDRSKLRSAAMGQLGAGVLKGAMDGVLKLPIVLRVLTVTEEVGKQSGKKITGPSYKLRVLMGDGSLDASKGQISVERRGSWDNILPGSLIKVTHCVPMLLRVGSEDEEVNEGEAPKEWTQLWFSIHGFDLLYSPTVSESKAFSHDITINQSMRHAFVTRAFVRKRVTDTAVQSSSAAQSVAATTVVADVVADGETVESHEEELRLLAQLCPEPEHDVNESIIASTGGKTKECVHVEETSFVTTASSSSTETTTAARDVIIQMCSGQVHDDTATSSNAVASGSDRPITTQEHECGGTPPDDDSDDDDTSSTSSEDDEDESSSDDDKTELRPEEILVDCDGSWCSDPETVSFTKCLIMLRPVESVDIRAIRKNISFAQNDLDKDLDNSLIRNVLYYFYYTTYLQLARERSGTVEAHERSELPKCVVAAIRHWYPNDSEKEYVGFIAQSTEPWW